MTRIVVVGTGAAGSSAALSARRCDRNAEIVAVERTRRPTYSKCGLPFVIGGVIPDFETLTVIPDDMYSKMKIQLRRGAAVEDLDTAGKTVKLVGEDGTEEMSYDSLIIAAGGVSSMPPVPGSDLPGVYALRTAEDGGRIMAAAGNARTAVVNGASFIALEVAEALWEKGLDVKLVVRSRALRSMIDKDLSGLVHKHLQEKGISVLLGNSVDRILGDGAVRSVEINGEEHPCDLFVMATGTSPDVELARKAGIELGETGGIKVDEHLRTSAPGVFAAGDCVESVCHLSGARVLTGLGTIAARQGMVCGANACGGSETAPPVLGAAVMKLAGLEVGCVGLTEDTAKARGLNPVAQSLAYPHLPHYYPGGKEVRVRLLADLDSGKLIGAQFVSEVPVAPRVNAMSIAIYKGMTVDELCMADLCYSPPCADIWDPAAVCAQTLQRKMERLRAK